jgi:hypothetical protein
MNRFLVLVTIFWNDRTKSATIMSLQDAIEMEIKDDPEWFDIDIQVWNDDKQTS